MKRPLRAAARYDRVLQAMGLMCLYVLLIVLVNAGGKVLTASAHPFQVVFFRHGGAAVFMTTAFVTRHGWAITAAKRPGLQVTRGVLGGVSSLFYFSGLASIALAPAAAISFTAPLVVTALSPLLLGEKVGGTLWAAVCAGFLGALIVIRPDLGQAGQWGALLLVGSAVCTGLYQIVTRALAGQDRAETTTIWTACISGSISATLVPWVWKTPPEPWIWVLSLSLGLIGGTGHFLLTRAFERGPAALLSPFNYLQLVGATVLGFLIYGALPDAATLTGAAVIVASGLYIAYGEHRRRRSLKEA